MTHKDFNRDHVLTIMAREFPSADLIHEILGGTGQQIMGLAKNYTEDERNTLRKAGINTLVEIDGKIYKPAGGITGAGTSMRASMASDRVIKATETLERALRNEPMQFQRLARDYGHTWPTNPTFEFVLLQPSGLAFKELSTNLTLVVA